MKFEGGCCCGALRYVAEGEPLMKAQCHCRECQYYTGGPAALVMTMPLAGFRYTKGEPSHYKSADASAATRDFCPACGTHTVSRPDAPVVVVKIGTLDDPTQFGAPEMAIHVADKQPFQHIADGLPAFERLRPR